MNPFEAHGIEHLSASTLHLFASSPAMFVLEKLLKRRQPVGAAAHRGNAVEAGIAHALTGGTEAEAVELAESKFRTLTVMSADNRREKEGEGIADMVRQGIAELKPYGEPTQMQGKIEHRFDGVPVPVIGYFDFAWHQHGILVDLKTTHRVPSEISTSHARQVSLYRAALGDNLDARLTYCSTKKAVTYRLENPREHIVALERIALTLGRFLSLSADPQFFASITVPDVDSYFLADPKARQAAFEVFGV